MPKKTIQIDAKLLDDIAAYCSLNDIKKNEFIERLIKNGFMIEKYGDKPSIINTKVNKKVEERPKGDISVVKKQETETRNVIKKFEI